MFGLLGGELLPPRPSFIGAVKTLPRGRSDLGLPSQRNSQNSRISRPQPIDRCQPPSSLKAGIHAAEVARGLESAQFQLRGQIIWAKQHFALSRGH
jgi:hypothetical protein